MQSLALAGFADQLFESLFANMAGSAFAQAVAPNPSGYYFNLSLYGAPPRWLFDLPLTPMGTSASTFKQGGTNSFGTALDVVSGQVKVVNAPVKMNLGGGKTAWLPPVWSYKTSKDFSTILPHTLFIRGMDMEINSHPSSNQRQISPIIGGYSINGMVADRSDRPLSSIVDNFAGASQGFKSKKGLAPSPVNTASASNLISILLASFKAIPANRKHVSGQNIQLQDQVFSRLERELASLGYTENSIASSYENAAELISANIQALANNYPATKAKYDNLIKAAVSPSKGSLAGLTSSKITPTLDPIFNLTTNTPASNLKLSDLRDMANPAINLTKMSQNFAVMELLTDRLSTNFSLTFPGTTGVPISSSGTFSPPHDQHYTGSAVSVFVTTLFYRGFLSCLTEFVDFLKAKNIFDSSVIHISSEFNRIPRNDGSGADHGIDGSTATLISGKFSGGNVIGNIKVDGSGRGTWGESAPFTLDGDTRPIHVNDVARTITGMLGVDDVATNGYSLLKPSGTKLWVPKRVEAKNV
jgi:hypothetical protein